MRLRIDGRALNPGGEAELEALGTDVVQLEAVGRLVAVTLDFVPHSAYTQEDDVPKFDSSSR
jgi:hypothetical protein